MFEKQNQEQKEVTRSTEKQKHENKSIRCFSRKSGTSTQTSDNNTNASAKLLVKATLLEKNLEQNQADLEKQINENARIKT